MASTIEAATGGVIIAESGVVSKQFQGLFQIIAFTFSFEEDSMAAGVTATRDITVTGAALGDFVLIAPSADVVSVAFSAWVRAANSVTIMALNLETSDANTQLATIDTHNGLILRPNPNVLVWAP